MALTRLGPNQLLNLASNVTGTLPAANGGTGATSFAPGKILQVVQTKIDSVISQSCNVGTRYDVTGLSASITPSSSSNKVLVHSSINFNNAAGEGFKGPSQAFEGQWGYLHSYASGGDVKKATNGLGEEFETLQTVVRDY